MWSHFEQSGLELFTMAVGLWAEIPSQNILGIFSSEEETGASRWLFENGHDGLCISSVVKIV